jgi:hypothetical protein
MNDLLASVVRLAAMVGAAGFEPATPATAVLSWENTGDRRVKVSQLLQ